MILLVASSPRGQECAAALAAATGQPAQQASSLRKAIHLLRTAEFSAVVVDEALLDLEPRLADAILEHGGAAVRVYLNFAISSTERIVREVKEALRRAEKERVAAMRAAALALRSELRGALTGILLSSQLALAVPSLPAAAAAKLKSVCELAEQMRNRLEG